ncbi:hypothetical protein FHG87_016744 [Trinorchestia longiramus]|nr:hypothetical protein FHG87_016744 [Trinorchestia longiramus]
MPSSRSRHRHKSRGKSRHRSSQSSFRNQSVSVARNTRTTSHPPPVHGRGAHEKTPQEVAEDHEYVKRVLAYLDRPEPAQSAACISGTKVKPSQLGKAQSKVQHTAKEKPKPPQCSKSKPPRAPQTERSRSANATGRKKLQDKKIKSDNSDVKENLSYHSSGAVPKKSKSQQIDELDLTVDPNLFDSDSDLSSTLFSMADASGSNDSISSLCAMLASMGAAQVTPDEIDASRTAIKANLLNGYSVDDSPLLAGSAATVLSANGASAVASNAADTKLENKNLLNTSGQLTVEELAAERKARKEAKKAKKVPGGSNENASQKERQLLVKESDKENVPLADQQPSDIPEKSKADLKKERRAIQEAQRAAKEKAMKTKTDAQIQSKQVLPTSRPSPVPVTTKPPMRATHRFTGLQNKPRVKGASNLPFVGLLRDPEYVIEKPTYATQVHPDFQKLAEVIYLNKNTANDAQCVSFLTCLNVFMSDYSCDEGTDVERDINERMSPNINYLAHYSVYTPPMRNIMRQVCQDWRQVCQDWRHVPAVLEALVPAALDSHTFFREMLRRANLVFKETLIELTKNIDLEVNASVTLSEGNSAEGNTRPCTEDIAAESRVSVVASAEGTDTEGINSVAATEGTDTEGINSVAVTEGTDTEGINSVAVTEGTDTEGINSVAATEGTDTEGINSVAVTEGTDTEGINSVAVTEGTDTEGINSVAATEGTHAESINSVAATEGTDTEGINSVAATEGTHAESINSVAATEGTDTEANTSVACSEDANSKNDVEDEEGEEKEPATPWSTALGKLKTSLKDWTTSFFHKTYVKNEANMFPKVLSFLESGDTLLLYGYSRLILKAIQHACSVGGMMLSVVVIDNLAENEDSGDMVGALQNTNLNGGFVLRAIIADLVSLVSIVSFLINIAV